MKILALESSATACSVALCEDGQLLAQTFQNSGLTHSRTLMPMARDLLAYSGHSLDEVDVIAVAAGPGSFTGLRIGIATAKGLAWAGGVPRFYISRRPSRARMRVASSVNSRWLPTGMP